MVQSAQDRAEAALFPEIDRALTIPSLS
jgi:hypothetical protein